MIHQMWRLSESGDDNLGPAITPEGLTLGRTKLVERRDEQFVVRGRDEIALLLGKAYKAEISVDGLMSGLAVVASALNANDPCLACIAAVHLKLPDLQDENARGDLEAADALIKYGDWNPELHPRTGTPPNPGWFAPTGGASESSGVQVAQNDDPNRRSDTSPALPDHRVKLPPGDYIDELHDFLEWLANAKPEDEPAIRAEIRRYYYSVGDTFGGDTLNRTFSDILEAGDNKKWRQQLLNDIASYAKTDPSEMGLIHGALPAAILSFPEALLEEFGIAAPESEAAAEVAAGENPWLMGWARRGKYFDELFRDGSLHPLSRTIDNFDTAGIATSIKSIDLRAPTYQDFGRLTSRLNKYLNDLGDYAGTNWGGDNIDGSQISGRALHLIVPKGSMTETQLSAIDAARIRMSNQAIKIIVTEF